MKGYKSIIWLLVIVICSGILLPQTGYAFSLTSQTASDTSSKGIFNVLASLLIGDLLTKFFHIDLNLPGITGPPKSVPPSVGNKEVIGFYAEWWGTDTSSYDDMVKHTDSIGTIVPFWGTLQADGSVSNRGGDDHASVVTYANKNKISTLLMVNNAEKNSSNGGIHAVLADPSLRAIAIASLESYLKKYNLNGVNIDFELVPASDRDNLTAFMRELSTKLKPKGYIVSIDVFPKHNEESDIAGAYDYEQLAKYADKIMLMTYDYHGGWSEPGAVADFPSVERDLKYALQFIPKTKVYLGVAGYGYDWSSKGVESMEYGPIMNLVDRFGATVQWDEASKAPHFSYTGPDGVLHQVWYENSYSIQSKLDLVKKYDIAGIALWKLGEEDPASWKVIKDNLPK